MVADVRLLIALCCTPLAQALVPPLGRSMAARGRLVRASSIRLMADDPSPDEKIAALEKELQALKLAALEKEFQDLKQAIADGAKPDFDRLEAVQQGLMDLKTTASAPSPEPTSEPEPAAESDGLLSQFKEAAQAASQPEPDFEPFPSNSALAVGGQRCAILFYAKDGIPKAEALLETFEDEASAAGVPTLLHLPFFLSPSVVRSCYDVGAGAVSFPLGCL